MVYGDGQDDTMQEEILLDLIGRYRWTWGGEGGADITKSFGKAKKDMCFGMPSK